MAVGRLAAAPSPPWRIFVLQVVIHAANDLRVEEAEEASPGRGQVTVQIGAGGICGSDLHYYQHGGFGAVRLKQPMVLGHEVAGTIVAVGEDVGAVKVGDLVAVNPSRPCGACEYCRRGQPRHCLHMLFYGSAMRFPHVHGAFRQRLVAEESQCFVMPPGCTLAAAAMTEPFAVALHAVSRAGPLIDRRVLVTGSGPIGALVVLAARLHGAREIVVTDILDEPLAKASEVGADRTVNVAADSEALAAYARDKGYFDVMFEASGNKTAILSGIRTLRPCGILVQLGLGSEAPLPLDLIVAREVEMRGSFRFDTEFGLAAELIGSGRAAVRSLLTHELPLTDAVAAFELAADRRQATKVQLLF